MATTSYPSPNPGGAFRFRIGQRLIYTPRAPGYPPRRVRVVKRTIEAALGKVYLIKDCKTGQRYGYTPESDLEEEEK